MVLQNILNTYVPLRAEIQNKDNGKAKIGCVAFSPKLNHQYVLCVWPQPIQFKLHTLVVSILACFNFGLFSNAIVSL